MVHHEGVSDYFADIVRVLKESLETKEKNGNVCVEDYMAIEEVATKVLRDLLLLLNEEIRLKAALGVLKLN